MKCKKCEKTKPAEEFYFFYGRKHQLCNPCRHEKQRAINKKQEAKRRQPLW